MITTKSSREIELMRAAGRIVALAHEAVSEIQDIHGVWNDTQKALED